VVDKAYPDQATLDESADQGAAEPEPDGGAARGATQAGTDGPEPEQHQDATQDLIENGESPECPECGSMQLYYSEGCKTCEGCGWSEC
jgi:ribonucleoside-diphosphate reductase alpha chain